MDSEMPCGWSCPNCDCPEYDLTEYGQKCCINCRMVFGIRTMKPERETLPRKKKIDWSKYNMFAKTSKGRISRLRHFGTGHH